MSITLYQSKTDPFRRGQTVHIFANGSSTCPIKAMVCYCNLLGKRNANGSVFKAGKFDPLTQKKLNDTLRCLLQQGGINQSNYASHSFRIGAATTAAAAGIPAWLIEDGIVMHIWPISDALAQSSQQFLVCFLVWMLLISHSGILIHVNSDHTVIYDS